jgi:UDP-N-acetylglucosamine 2-epimerase
MMPEERNRILVDHISDFIITPTKNSTDNLINENINPKKIKQFGDLNLLVFKRTEKSYDFFKKINLMENNYLLLTLHRSNLVDVKEKLEEIIEFLNKFEEKIIFLVHPRTKKSLKKFNLFNKLNENILIYEPISYKNLLGLIEKSKFVLTDSGGVQRESFYCKKPCIILREETEWEETLKFNSYLFKEIDLKKIKLKKDYNPEDIFGKNIIEKITDFIVGLNVN